MTRNQRRLMPLAGLAAAFVMVAGLAVGLGARGATAHGDEAAHPAHIHTGTCDALGDVVFPLSDVGGTMMDAAGTAVAGTAMGPDSAIPADASITTVQADLATIIGGGHTINIHESAENIGNYIACGDIGGVVMGSDLAIGIGELNGSGYSGAAWLHDNGDGTTTVAVFLTESGEGGGEAAAGAMAVDIKDFAFNPASLEITVGTTVTWTNSDAAPHTATQNPSGSGFQSGRLDSGATFSQTFDTAGTFDYFCEFHPNMKGTIVVN